MDNTPCSRKMLNRHRFRPHLMNSRINGCSSQPVSGHLERNSPQLIGLKVNFLNSSALSNRTLNINVEIKESVISRLEVVDGDAERRPENRQYVRYVDEGYVTLCAANLSPAPRSGQSQVPVDDGYRESPAKRPRLDQEVKPELQFSFTGDDVCPAHQSGLPLEPQNIGECFEDDVEGAWNIGQPIFESSVCHSFVNVDAVDERSGLESEEVHKDDPEPSLRSLASDSGLNTSWETTILPYVKVKSEVVVPDRPSCPPIVYGRNLRSVTFDEAYWKQKKDRYINLVSRHFMYENPKANHDAMSDLVDLMSHVTKQSAGSRSDTWKHPSDFTRRNYQTRFALNKTKMSLQEWQSKHGKTLKRFSNLPKIFTRSSCH